jgi:hypothetical protein
MGQLRKRGNVWWMRYYRNGERLEESARTSEYEVARDLMNSRQGDVADGRPVSPKAGRLRFNDAAADLETEYTVNGRRTLKHLQRRIKKHLTPWFATRRLVDIDTADVRALTAARLKASAAAGGSESRARRAQADVLARDEGRPAAREAVYPDVEGEQRAS